MKTVKLIVSSFLGLAISTGVYAQNPGIECDPIDLRTVVYIEEESELDLGFDTRDYLPNNFDPYRLYVDLEKIAFVNEEETDLNYQDYLPAEFDAYANPIHFRNIDYIDPADEESLDFNPKDYLPEGFDPYRRNIDTTIVHL